MINNNRGFTFVEVAITVIIVSMLSIIGVFVYKKHIDNAKYNEGMRLLELIKEQQDLALSFASDNSNPFIFKFYDENDILVADKDVIVSSTVMFNRKDQNLGYFRVYPQHNKYFKRFKIRDPRDDERVKYNVAGYGYVVETYCYASEDDALSNKVQLTLRLIGSSEGSYTVIRE
ncbi:MAG: prepilin-type N-terminal cleavage/methylation domain-containing protein [Endomicrobia bacterium]|nr:prepilin-type N-terminal cleavage/methylation domain-containing protein [Endomicrobiia bacterium]